jgi:MYXO-CTERM domain-containing protein
MQPQHSSRHPNRSKGLRVLAVTTGFAAFSIFSAVLPGSAKAGSINPSSFNTTLDVGEAVKVAKTVFTTAGSSLVDFLFLADNTGSMGGVINSVKNTSTALLSSLNSSFADARFSVARYFGDPIEFGTTSNGPGFNAAYDVLTPLTANTSSVTSGINGWIASDGGDGPEANFYALQQAVTNGASTSPGLGSLPGFFGGSGEAIGWRTGAQKVILWFGDATSHQDTVTLDNVKAALAGTNSKLVALNSSSAGSGIDGNFADGGQAGDQASSIVNFLGLGTDAAIFNNFASVPTSNIVSTIITLVGDVTGTIDLSLVVGSGDTSGLDVSFTCTDALGCDDVPLGESRTFDMDILALTPGTYDFTVIAPGVAGAVETDSITVTGGGTASVPGPLPMLGVGAGFAWSRRLRNRIRKSVG